VFCKNLGTDREFYRIQREKTGFYNQDGVGLLRGKN